MTILLMIVSGKSFSQDIKEQTNVQIKPALLVIDIHNVYLSMVPEREKEVAMYYINGLIELFHNNGYPVIRIYHFDKESGPKPGFEQFEYPSSILVKDEDPKVIKTYEMNQKQDLNPHAFLGIQRFISTITCSMS